MLTHRNLTTMVACHFISVDSTGPDDSIIYAAPMSHGAGMGNFANVIAAARHVVTREGFEPAEVQALAQHHQRAFMFAAPTMVKRLADYIEQSGTDPGGLRTILYGGGPMYLEDIKQALRVIGEDRFVQAYGQGETPMTITLLGRAQFSNRDHPRYEARLASVGVAQSLVEVRVTDAEGRALPHGEVGEILVRGDTVMHGYWDNPEATAKTLRDGWLYTGDMGFFDADGFLTLKDRSKDMIISGGSNIYPREIEEVLLQHPGVHEVSVVGRRHSDWGEEVVAFVVAKPGAQLSESELDTTCLAQIARFKRPRAYRFVEALPKSNYGKVLKTELREWLAREGLAGGGAS
jgi:long-chain acyl-CoA synthetase